VSEQAAFVEQRSLAKTKLAIVDPEAFYPFRTLVNGPLERTEELIAAEEFLRAVVLHDELEMEAQPFAFDGHEDEWSEDDIEAGGRNVIVAIAPTVAEYGLFNDRYGPREVPAIQLTPQLESLAATYANAGPGNAYYNAHLDFLKRIAGNLQNGGSALCKGDFIQEAIQTAATFPNDLFKTLDKDWQEFGLSVKDSIGPLVPPVLGIVLTRSASRDKIPAIVRDLRDEWAPARSKVWELVDGLKTARTLVEAKEIKQELTDASKHFSPLSESGSSQPLQILWELFVGGIGGAVTASVIGQDARIGAATGIVGQGIRVAQRELNFGRVLFGKGAFDLAKRVRREVERVELTRLRTFLTDAERKALGL
jgi:hypothetical protein